MAIKNVAFSMTESELAEWILVTSERYRTLIQAEVERNIMECAIEMIGSYELSKLLSAIKEARKLSSDLAEGLLSNVGELDAE